MENLFLLIVGIIIIATNVLFLVNEKYFEFGVKFNIYNILTKGKKQEMVRSSLKSKSVQAIFVGIMFIGLYIYITFLV